MDDLQEQKTADVQNVGQFCYISSWTDDNTESIPMWNMYASLNQGVRIRIRKNPFKRYNNTVEELSNIISINDNSKGNLWSSIIPLKEIFFKGFFSVQAMTGDLLFKVEYTNDTEKLYPSILREEGDQFTIALGELGKYKNSHWSFQREWRYILQILPLNLNQPVESSVYDFQIIANRIRMGLEKQPFPFYDMSISDEAFNDMEITLSPQISSGSKVIVENLVEKYNSSAVIIESKLLGLI